MDSDTPSDTPFRTWICGPGFGGNDATLRVEGEPQPELGVDLGLIGRISPFQGRHDVTELRDEAGDLLLAHPVASLGPLQSDLGVQPFALHLSDPLPNDDWVDAGVERGPVLRESVVAAESSFRRRSHGHPGKR